MPHFLCGWSAYSSLFVQWEISKYLVRNRAPLPGKEYVQRVDPGQ